ncbi:MAG: hypothetical protein QME12_09045 [Nanoarchaeota archaeon]|nr:hypothetical protein [Nanoarchaeota archaeon]
MDNKGQAEIRTFVGLALLMIGVLSATFIGMGFIFNQSVLVWVGSIMLGIISVTAAILEKVLLR